MQVNFDGEGVHYFVRTKTKFHFEDGRNLYLVDGSYSKPTLTDNGEYTFMYLKNKDDKRLSEITLPAEIFEIRCTKIS